MSSVPNEDRLGELLLRWDELRRGGQDLAVEDLCADCPELIAELRRRVALLRAINPVLDSGTPRPASSPLDEIPLGGVARRGLPDVFQCDGVRPDRSQAGTEVGKVPANERSAFSDYEILGELGRGGMGVVFRAYDKRRDQIVALKTMRRLGPSALDRFKREFRALAELSHPNLVALHELVSDGIDWFFTMELVEGVNIVEHIRSGAPVGRIGRLRDALHQLAMGVAAVHSAGKLHRDLKPSNVPLSVTPDGRVVLLDFGLAAELEERDAYMSTERHVLGTAAYMAPEQAAGGPVSSPADWYSVGVILHEALTGQLPFCGDSVEMTAAKRRAEPCIPRELVHDAPEDLVALCTRLLRWGPAARPAALEVYSQLRGRSHDPEIPVVHDARSKQKPLIGRRHQVEALTEAFADVQRGRTVSVLVEGESGVGKTALIQHFVKGVSRRDEAVVLIGRCHEREFVPFRALDSLVDSLCRYLSRLSADDVQPLLPRDVLSLLRVFPALGRIEAIASGLRRAVPAPDPQELRRRAFSALRDLLARLGDRRPLILFIDDLQWGDVDSALLLSELLRPPDPPSLLLLGAYRSQDAAANPFLRTLRERADLLMDCRHLAIGPLSHLDAEELALSLLGKEDLSTKLLAAAIVRESGGNPFFLHEVAGSLQRDDDCALKGGPGGGITLDEVLWARIARLPEQTRRLLEVIAVSGRPLGEVEACQAADLAGERAALVALRCDRLVRGTGSTDGHEVETYHDRVRETVLAHIAPQVLEHHHGRLASVLETSGRTGPEILAVHLRAAGDVPRAVEYYARAASQAAEALAFDHAAELYRLVLELQSKGTEQGFPLRIGLADALANAGRGAEAAREYLTAANEAVALDKQEPRRRAAMQYLISGHIDEGLDALREVLGSAGMKLPRTPRHAFWSVIFGRLQLRLRGIRYRPSTACRLATKDLEVLEILKSVVEGLSLVDPICAAAFQTKHLLMALRVGEPSRIARALALETGHVSVAGTASRRRSLKLMHTAEIVAERVGTPEALGMLCVAKAAAAYNLGRWSNALGFSDEAEALFRDRCTGVAWEIGTAQTFALWSLSYLGEIGALSRRLATLVKGARERDDIYVVANVNTASMSIARLAEDDPDGARRELQEVMGRWSRRGFHVQHHNRVVAYCYIELYQGNYVSAWDYIMKQRPYYARSFLSCSQLVRVDIAQLRARCALATARTLPTPYLLLRAVEKDARRLDRQNVAYADAHSAFVRAGLIAVRGGARLAVDALHAAAVKYKECDMLLYYNAIIYKVGEIVGGHEGQALLAEAKAWMTSQGIRNPTRMAAMYAPGLVD